MIIKIRFLDFVAHYYVQVLNIMDAGVLLSNVWPKCESFRELIETVNDEENWSQYIGTEEPVCQFDLNDEGEVMLVFNEHNLAGIQHFREYLYSV